MDQETICANQSTHTKETAGFPFKHTELPRDNVQSHMSPDLTKHFHKGKALALSFMFPNTGDLIPAATTFPPKKLVNKGPFNESPVSPHTRGMDLYPCQQGLNLDQVINPS